MAHRVLMIDDALPLHRIVESRLGDDDVEVFSAVDGSAGLTAANHLRPSVILLDVDLPDMDGFEVCRRLKANGATAEIPIIFLTAEGGPARQVGLDLGAVDYVTKPFRTEELSARVAASIRKGERRAQTLGVDGITGLWTRARLDAYLAARAAQPAACVVADVDGLRLINARHGVPFGDAVLRAVGGILTDGFGPGAVACSAGAGRFVVVVPNGARRVARQTVEAIGDALRDRPIAGPQGEVAHVTCGFGIADTGVVHGDASRLVGRAEAVLAHAKRSGPGRIAVARARDTVAAAAAAA